MTEYTVPVEHRATVTAEIEYPDKSHGLVKLTEDEPGVFKASMAATLAGIYQFRIVAEGGTSRGLAFTREQIASAAVWNGGDRPDQPPHDTGQGDWCRLLTCLLSENVFSREFEERLRKEGINLDGIRRCVKECCR